MAKVGKVCPECDYDFKGKGWTGIDAHWKKYHDHVRSYKEAWPDIRDGNYLITKKSQEGINSRRGDRQ